MRVMSAAAVLAALCFSPCAGPATALDLASVEKKVSTKVLDNGLTMIVYERPEAPVFSYFTHVDVGADREVPGITGLAHMFEHMAFKGTQAIGTRDSRAETTALGDVEKTYAAYDAQRRTPGGPDPERLRALEQAWRKAMAKADSFVVKSAFDEIIEREGGVGLNAYTNHDETGYFFSMPSNRLELWAYLESERYLDPVMREFYKERKVVMEERRMRTDSHPVGRLIEQFRAAAFTAHPYGRPVVGWMSDLQTFSATDALEFHRRNYIPANMVVTVVGDVKATEVFRLAEQYFSRLPKRPKPSPLRTVEPEQKGERTVVLRDAAQPFYIEGYHKGAARHADDAVFDVLSDLLSSGRTSRLYRALVRDKKIAARSAGFSGFPGTKYPNLFAVFAVPLPGHTPAEVQAAIREEVERLKTEDVSEEELNTVKIRTKANLIRQLNGNQGLALQLGSAQARLGDWRELFRQVEHIEAVTQADIRRVANTTFTAANRTVGIMESTRTAHAPQGGV